MDLYGLLIQTPSGEILVGAADPTAPLISIDNTSPLIELGDELIMNKMIVGYQLFKIVGKPVRAAEIDAAAASVLDKFVKMGG